MDKPEDKDTNAKEDPVGDKASGLKTTDFQDEIDMLYKEMNDLDDLFFETKQHLDQVRNSQRNVRVQGAFTFLSNQTTTLVSLKSTKLSLIKSLIDVKNKQFQNDVKLNEVNNGDDEGVNDSAVLTQLIEHLSLNRAQNAVKDNIQNLPNDAEDEQLESMRDSIKPLRVPELEEGHVEESSDTNSADETYIVQDEFGTVYEVTINNTILNVLQDLTATITLETQGDITATVEGEEVQVLQRSYLLDANKTK